MTADNFTITLTPDFSELQNALDEWNGLFPDKASIPQEFLSRVESPSELVCIDVDNSPTSETSEVRVLFKPSDLFLDLIATARASKGEG